MSPQMPLDRRVIDVIEYACLLALVFLLVMGVFIGLIELATGRRRRPLDPLSQVDIDRLPGNLLVGGSLSYRCSTCSEPIDERVGLCTACRMNASRSWKAENRR